MSKNKIKVSKIEIEINKKTISLTIKEAKELYDQFEELFGKDYIPSTPIIIERDNYPWRHPWIYPPIISWSTKTIQGTIDKPESKDFCTITCQSGLSINYLSE
tara:strand:- start:409 stop:717 length:309 start_codon:yes stop_codon:yes gene_type:complete